MKRIPLLAATLLLTGCSSMIDNCDDCITPPSPIALKIVSAENHSSNLVTQKQYHPDTLYIWYEDDDHHRQKVPTRIINNSQYSDVLYTEMPLLAEIDELSTFYLYLNYLDTDTIELLVEESDDGCCTSFPLRLIRINGKNAILDENDFTYLVEK